MATCAHRIGLGLGGQELIPDPPPQDGINVYLCG